MFSKCVVQLIDGSHCQNEVHQEGKCFWHSDAPKTDENVRMVFPQYSSLKELIEKARPILEKVVFSKISLMYVDFSNAAMAGAQFFNSDLTGAQFINANLRSIYFCDTKLTQANFTNAVLDKGAIERSILTDAILDNASLINTRVIDSELINTSCIGSNFKSTKLKFVNLYRANIKHAKFSNREVQLRFCNTEEPILSEYLQNKALSWLSSKDKNNALRCVEYLQPRIATDQFNSWIQKIIVLVKDNYESAKQEHDFREIGDNFEFIAKLFKMIGPLPLVLALPDSPKKEGPVYHELLFRAEIATGELDLVNCSEYLATLKDFIGRTEELVGKYSVASQTTRTRITYLSYNSPFEIGILAGGGVIVAALTIITLWQKIILNHLKIGNEYIEREVKKGTLENLRLEKSIKLKQMGKEVADQLNISRNDADSMVEKADVHLTYVNDSRAVSKYSVSSQDVKIELKDVSSRSISSSIIVDKIV